MHCYGDQFQLLPVEFELPNMNLLTFILWWLCGDKDTIHLLLHIVRVVDLKTL